MLMISEMLHNKVVIGLIAAVVASLFLRITSGLFFKVAAVALIGYGIWYLI